MRSVIAFATSVVLLCAAACSTRADRSELVGTYVLHAPDTTVDLTLNANGNFDQIIHESSKQPIKATGTWEWNEKLRMVILNDAIDIRNGKPGMKMIVAIPIVKSFGSIRLDVDPDAGYPYRKTEH